MSRYDDIINLPHHVSPTRPRMSMHDRAAQFAPFAALVGYDDTVAETARLTESRPVLDEQEQKELDMRLRYLADHLKEQLVVHIQYFVPDERKSGSAIMEFNGVVRKIVNGVIVTADDINICIEDIIALDVVRPLHPFYENWGIN